MAGLVGGRVWAAVPDLNLPRPRLKGLSSIALGDIAPRAAARPTAWFRVILGAAIIVAGVGMAEKVRRKAETTTDGYLQVQTRGQARFLSWQMATLAVLCGGVVAGAGTGAGVRYGVLAVVVGAVGVVAAIASRGEVAPPLEYALTQLNLPAAHADDPATLVAAGVVVLVPGVVGGWFGGLLFLPLAPAHMRRSRPRLGID